MRHLTICFMQTMRDNVKAQQSDNSLQSCPKVQRCIRYKAELRDEVGSSELNLDLISNMHEW